jgi:hypothetical protein
MHPRESYNDSHILALETESLATTKPAEVSSQVDTGSNGNFMPAERPDRYRAEQSRNDASNAALKYAACT